MSDERHTCMHTKMQTPVFLIVSIDNLPQQKTLKYSYKSVPLSLLLAVLSRVPKIRCDNGDV